MSEVAGYDLVPLEVDEEYYACHFELSRSIGGGVYRFVKPRTKGLDLAL